MKIVSGLGEMAVTPEQREVEAGVSKEFIQAVGRAVGQWARKYAKDIAISAAVPMGKGGFKLQFGIKSQEDLLDSFFREGEFTVVPVAGGGKIGVNLIYKDTDKRLYIGELSVTRNPKTGDWEVPTQR